MNPNDDISDVILLPRHTRAKNELMRRYHMCLKAPHFLPAFFFSFVWLCVSLVINQYAIDFATESASNSVTDIILSNIPTFDVDALFVYGTALVVAYSIIILLCDPKRIPFALKGVALFFLIRAVFVSLTHIAPFTPHLSTDFGDTVNRLFFGGDRFFSGHTGLPFLGALAFWDWKFQRNVFLIASVFFGIIVLLGHLHYSIDVASAFFITYGIYDIAKWMFPKDYAFFKIK